MRPGAKLLGLLVLAGATVAFRDSVWITASLAALSLGFVALAGTGWRAFWRACRGFALVGTLLFAFHTWQTDAVHSASIVLGLFALVLAAIAFSASTNANDLLDTLVWLLTPLRPLGVQPDRIALSVSLMTAAIPRLFEVARETRAAAKARGLERNPRALLIPLALRTVSHAQLTGDALAARGVGDE